MRNSDFYMTFGQVVDVSIENSFSYLNKFTEYVDDQTKQNEELQKDDTWSISSQTYSSQKKYIEVLYPSTNYEEVAKKYLELKEESKRLRKISTCPIISAYIYEQNTNNSIVPKIVKCVPLNRCLLEVPTIGQWIVILVANNSVISNTENVDSYKYFYFPFSIDKRKFEKIENITSLKEKTNSKLNKNSVKNVMWPRTGSTIVQNENGKSNIQVNENSLLFSSGFGDLPQGLDSAQVLQQKVHEFFKLSPPENIDSFLFIDRYDREWEQALNEYKKRLYELLRFDDTSVVDKIISDLFSVKSFKDRIKVFFGIDFSNKYEWKYSSPSSENVVDKSKDNGMLLAAENIYLGKNSKNSQKDFTVARSEPTQDLLFGTIDVLIDLFNLLSTHKHLGTPASVLDPTPDFVSKLKEVETKIKKIQDELKEIQSPSIHIC